MPLVSAWTTMVERVSLAKELIADFNTQVLGNLLYLYDVQAGHGGFEAEFVDVDVATTGQGSNGVVQAATTANVNLASDLELGDVIDGVTLAAGDRVLVKDQAAGQDNGVYVIQATGAAVRGADLDESDELDGAAVAVELGTANAGTFWRNNTAAPMVIGTTPTVWGSYTPASDVQSVGLHKLEGLTLDRLGWWSLEISGAVRPSARDKYDAVQLQAAICSEASIGEHRENVLVYGPRLSSGPMYFKSTSSSDMDLYAKVLLEVTTGSKSVSAYCIKWGTSRTTLPSLASGRFIAEFLGKAA